MSWEYDARKALESRLELTADGFDIPVHWYPFALPSPRPLRYFRFSMHFGTRLPREWGKDPRIEASGHIKIGVFTQMTMGPDDNDELAGIAAAAYPYDDELLFGSTRVSIGAVDKRDAVPDEDTGWLYSPVNVPWTVWRT